MYFACTCTIILANVNFDVIAWTLDLLVFDFPKTIFKFINSEMAQTPQAKPAGETLEQFDFICHVCYVS